MGTHGKRGCCAARLHILDVLVTALCMLLVKEAHTYAGKAEDLGTLMVDRRLESLIYSYFNLLTYLTQLREVQKERQEI